MKKIDELLRELRSAGFGEAADLMEALRRDRDHYWDQCETLYSRLKHKSAD